MEMNYRYAKEELNEDRLSLEGKPELEPLVQEECRHVFDGEVVSEEVDLGPEGHAEQPEFLDPLGDDAND